MIVPASIRVRLSVFLLLATLVDGNRVIVTPGGPGTALVALDNKTGATIWTFAGDGALRYPPAIAGSTVYVSSDSNVYAVDMTTHVASWTAPVGGWLSIGAGMLFVSGGGVLSAYKLTR